MLELKTKNGNIVQIYRFASAFYTRVISADGFTLFDSIGQSKTNGGTYENALRDAYQYTN